MLARVLRRRASQDPFAATAAAIVSELSEAPEGWVLSPLKESPTARALLYAAPADQIETVLGALMCNAQVTRRGGPHGWGAERVTGDLVNALLRRRLPWTDESLAPLLDALIASARSRGDGPLLRPGYGDPVNGVLRAIEHATGDAELCTSVAGRLRTVRGLLLAGGHADAENRKAARRIDTLLEEAGASELLVTDEDPWARALLEHLETLEDGDRQLAERLVALAATATASKPTKAFGVEQDRLLVEHGREAVGAGAGGLLCAAAAAKSGERFPAPPPETGDALRGLAWVAGAGCGEGAARGLAALAIVGWKKVPNVGPLSHKAANAALNALAELPEGASHLGRVRSQLRQANAVRAADAAVDRAADRLGIDRSEFEERVVPDFGLDAGGLRPVQLGDHTAELELLDDLSTELRFRTSVGESIKSAPAALRAEHPDELARLRQTAKDVAAMAGAQRLRLERLLLDDRRWTAEQWRARYRDHGLVGALARRLIWIVDAPDGPISVLPSDGGLIDHDGLPVAEPSGAASVRLWHPAVAPPSEVHAWRVRLEERAVRQPFKQAHREVYLLTDAERETATYSNRFAAHILRQHQMAALARDRGWRYALQGHWDQPEEQAVLELPRHGLSASFWVERPWDAEDWNASGVFIHVLSDQVRFEDDEGDAVGLDTLAPRLFSEVMRDVDLFVGLTSIGNDPTWLDNGGDDRRFREYWTGFAFGALTEQATVRRELLERLLPKLAIADVAQLEGRYLRVRGCLRTYRIHLGSANVLMEPNDQYLCIVPGRGTTAADRVFLPFEGDQVLALVLSKAFLLARDDKIEDRTIMSQIRRGG